MMNKTVCNSHQPSTHICRYS